MTPVSNKHVPRKWAQHPFTWVPRGVFALIGGGASLVYTIKVVGGIIAVVSGLGSERTLYWSALWMVINGVILSVVIVITSGCLNSFLVGLRTTWDLDDEKLNERYDGIARGNAELHYHRISEVAIYQGMWGRIFGYGTLTLTLQGRDNKWYIPNTPHPYTLRDYFSVIASKNSHKPPQ